MSTIEQAHHEVERCVSTLMALSERKTGTATELEEQVWIACLGLGRAVMTSFFRRQAAKPRPASYSTTAVGTRTPAGKRRRWAHDSAR